MKKITAIILSAIMLITLAVCVCAEGTDDYTWTSYNFFADDMSAYTAGVTFYRNNGNAITIDEAKTYASAGYPGNIVTTDDKTDFLIWGANASRVKGGSIEIKFTGAGIRLISTYRAGAGTSFAAPEADITIDGVKQTVNNDLFKEDGETGERKVIFEATGLENKEHTLVFKLTDPFCATDACPYGMECELGSFEVTADGAKAPAASGNATDSGSDSAGDGSINTFDPITVASLAAVVSLAGTAVAVRKKQH